MVGGLKHNRPSDNFALRCHYIEGKSTTSILKEFNVEAKRLRTLAYIVQEGRSDLTVDPSPRISNVLQDFLKWVSLFPVLCLAAGALADQLDPLDACGALAVSADQATVVEEMVKKLSGGYSVAQAVAKCNENKELCQRVKEDLRSRKIAVPKGLTCSK